MCMYGINTESWICKDRTQPTYFVYFISIYLQGKMKLVYKGYCVTRYISR